MSVEYKDYYKILGVTREATEKEIRSAYRKLARQYHPDVNAGAEDKFKEINEANEVLGDPEKRKMYDSLGSNWRQGQNFNAPPGWGGGGGNGGYTINMNDMHFGDMGGFSSFFETLFGGGMGGMGGHGMPHGFGQQPEMDWGQSQPRARQQAPENLNTEHPLTLTLEEVATGVSKEVRTPSGKHLTVNIPRGVKPGAKIRLTGEGKTGARGNHGDLMLVVNYREHPKFKMDDDLTLVYEAQVPVPDLVLGTDIAVPTLDGSVSLTIPEGTQPGKRMRLKGQGMPDKSGTKGDLLVTITAQIPQYPTDRELELYRELQALAAR